MSFIDDRYLLVMALYKFHEPVHVPRNKTMIKRNFIHYSASQMDSIVRKRAPPRHTSVYSIVNKALNQYPHPHSDPYSLYMYIVPNKVCRNPSFTPDVQVNLRFDIFEAFLCLSSGRILLQENSIMNYKYKIGSEELSSSG